MALTLCLASSLPPSFPPYAFHWAASPHFPPRARHAPAMELEGKGKKRNRRWIRKERANGEGKRKEGKQATESWAVGRTTPTFLHTRAFYGAHYYLNIIIILLTSLQNTSQSSKDPPSFLLPLRPPPPQCSFPPHPPPPFPSLVLKPSPSLLRGLHLNFGYVSHPHTFARRRLNHLHRG